MAEDEIGARSRAHESRPRGWLLGRRAATQDTQPRGPHWERSPALSPAFKGGTGLSLGAAAGPASDAALGEIQLQGHSVSTRVTGDLWGRRAQGLSAVAPGNSFGGSLVAPIPLSTWNPLLGDKDVAMESDFSCSLQDGPVQGQDLMSSHVLRGQ